MMMQLNSPQHVRLMRNYERTCKRLTEYIKVRERVPDTVRENHQEALVRLRWFLDNAGCPKLLSIRNLCVRCLENDERSERALKRLEKLRGSKDAM